MKNGMIKVLVIDDSALVRQVLTEILNQDPQISVVGSAADPYIAREKIKALNPDVLTLDVEMPRMDGIAFLRNLMRLRPMPVVMVSSLTEEGAEVTLEALELGAIDFISKPKLDISQGLRTYADELVEKVKIAATARPQVIRRSAPASQQGSSNGVAPAVQRARFSTTDKVIAIGASTGGIEAIHQVLDQLPADAPAVVIAQHIPAGFSAAFAERMNRQTGLMVKEAENGDQLLPGHVYIAPGDQHLLLTRDGARYVCRLDGGPEVNRHRPSVDVLFRSVLEAAGNNAVAALLTGMGTDGAQGLLELRQAGIHTIAQDEASSVVWGMPGEAVRLDAVTQLLSVDQVGEGLLEAMGQK